MDIKRRKFGLERAQVHHGVGRRWSFQVRVGVATRRYPKSADDHRATQLHHVSGRHRQRRGAVWPTEYRESALCWNVIQQKKL